MTTLAIYIALERYVSRNIDARFASSVYDFRRLLYSKITDYCDVLAHTRGFFTASDRVNAAEFEAFVHSTEIFRRHRAISAIEYIEWVPAGSEEAFQLAAQDDGLSLQIYRSSEDGDSMSDDLYVIKYTVATTPTEQVLGFDVGSRAIIRATLDRAASNGQYAMTPPLRLAQAPDLGKVVIIYMPYYTPGMPLDTVEDRRQAVRGWFAAVCPTAALMTSVAGRTPGGLRIEVTDVTDSNNPLPVFTLGNTIHANAAANDLSYHDTLSPGGRQWTLDIRTHKEFLSAAGSFTPEHVLPLGLLITAALMAVTWSLTSTKSRALTLAEQMTASLRVAEAEARKLALVAARTHNAVYITDAFGRIEWVNEAFVRITGYTLDEARGRIPDELFWGPSTNPSSLSYIRGCVREGRGFHAQTLHYRQDRTQFWAMIEGQPLNDSEGKLVGYMGLLADITEQKRAEEQLREAAQTDRLTGLLNREQFLIHVDRAIDRHAQTGRYGYAVLFLDFDRFKLINDSLGHHTGDQLLIEVARRLEHEIERLMLAHTEQLESIVARAGGDEFAILISGDVTADLAGEFAESLITALARPYQLADHEVHFVASVGITTSAMNYTRSDEVLRDADNAMYAAKASGKASFVLFDTQMHQDALMKLRLESDLRKALDRNELKLVYQPIVSLETGRLQGFETLMRWHHPELGLVPPTRFIPIAEESGLIAQMGAWALWEACRQLAEWRRNEPDTQHLRMNVNLSRKQLLQINLVETVATALEDHNLPASVLHLEITESMLMEMSDSSSKTLARLREMGVRLVMDDFGTGYSSLSYLHQFPICGLKIDRSFVNHMAERRDLASIVQAIIDLAHSLNIRVTAEGIETQAQLVQLQALECDDAQGYFFAKPLSIDDATGLIRQYAARASAA